MQAFDNYELITNGYRRTYIRLPSGIQLDIVL